MVATYRVTAFAVAQARRRSLSAAENPFKRLVLEEGGHWVRPPEEDDGRMLSDFETSGGRRKELNFD